MILTYFFRITVDLLTATAGKLTWKGSTNQEISLPNGIAS
jgi:hypothetical protein